MREALDRDIREVSADFIRMISYTREQLELAGHVLLEKSLPDVQRVHDLDRTVDELEVKIETECLRIIARHQPVASDLRLVAAVLKSLSDLERVGDYAVHVAEIFKKIFRRRFAFGRF